MILFIIISVIGVHNINYILQNDHEFFNAKDFIYLFRFELKCIYIISFDAKLFINLLGKPPQSN